MSKLLATEVFNQVELKTMMQSIRDMEGDLTNRARVTKNIMSMIRDLGVKEQVEDLAAQVTELYLEDRKQKLAKTQEAFDHISFEFEPIHIDLSPVIAAQQEQTDKFISDIKHLLSQVVWGTQKTATYSSAPFHKIEVVCHDKAEQVPVTVRTTSDKALTETQIKKLRLAQDAAILYRLSRSRTATTYDVVDV